MDDPSELFALRIENVNAAGPAAVYVACGIDFHAIRAAGLAPAQVRENAVGLLRQRSVGKNIEGADVATPGIARLQARA